MMRSCTASLDGALPHPPLRQVGAAQRQNHQYGTDPPERARSSVRRYIPQENERCHGHEPMARRIGCMSAWVYVGDLEHFVRHRAAGGTTLISQQYARSTMAVLPYPTPISLPTMTFRHVVMPDVLVR